MTLKAYHDVLEEDERDASLSTQLNKVSACRNIKAIIKMLELHWFQAFLQWTRAVVGWVGGGSKWFRKHNTLFQFLLKALLE